MNDCAPDYLHEPNSTLRHMTRSSVLRVEQHIEALKMLLVEATRLLCSISLVTEDLWNLEYVWRIW